MCQSLAAAYRLIALIVTLCLPLAWRPVASAQEQPSTRVLLVVRDTTQAPLSGIAFLTVDASGREQVYRTDADGRVSFPVVGASIWLKAATNASGVTMQMDANTPNGGMFFALEGGDLALAFAAEDGFLFRPPFYMENPAFPELEHLGPEEATVLLFDQAKAAAEGVTPEMAATTTATAATPDSAVTPEVRGFPLTLVLLGGALLLVVGVGLFVYARRVLAYRRRAAGGGQ